MKAYRATSDIKNARYGNDFVQIIRNICRIAALELAKLDEYAVAEILQDIRTNTILPYASNIITSVRNLFDEVCMEYTLGSYRRVKMRCRKSK